MLTLVRCPFHPRVTAVARKRPRPFCHKCRWQVTPKHAYTLNPMRSDWARTGLTMPLSRHSLGTYQETSLHATRRGTLSHSRLSSLSHCGLILAYRVESVCASESSLIFFLILKHRRSNLLPKSSQARKKPPQPWRRQLRLQNPRTTMKRTRRSPPSSVCQGSRRIKSREI